MRRIAFSIAIVLAVASAAEEEEPSFAAFVLDQSGTVEVRRADADAWRPLKEGDRLQLGDTIRTDKKSSVQLLFTDNSATKIAASQEFTLSAAKKGDEKKESGLWGSLRALFALGEDLSVTAAARAFSPYAQPIVPVLPNGGAVKSPGFSLQWEGGDRALPFEVTIRDSQGAIVLQETTDKHRCDISLNSSSLHPGQAYWWSVAQPPTGKPLTSLLLPAPFYLLSQEEAKAAEAGADAVRKASRGVSPEALHAALASYWAGQGLDTEADREIMQAIQANPQGATIRFLLRALRMKNRLVEVTTETRSPDGQPAFALQKPENPMKSGSQFRATVESVRPCHVRAFLLAADGTVAPLPRQGASTTELAGSGEKAVFPRADSWYKLDNNRGIEVLFILASAQAIPEDIGKALVPMPIDMVRLANALGKAPAELHTFVIDHQ